MKFLYVFVLVGVCGLFQLLSAMGCCIFSKTCDDDEDSRVMGDTDCIKENVCENGMWYCNIELDKPSDVEILDGCNEIIGNLTIRGKTIDSLEALSSITKVGGVLIIEDTSLKNLTGLNSLTDIGGLELRNNAYLTDISALQSIVCNCQYSSVIIIENPQLSSLNGLQRYEELRELIISGNDALVDLTGFDSLRSVSKYFTIDENNSLVDFGGLSVFSEFGGGETPEFPLLLISDNQSLTSLDALYGIQSMVGLLQIHDNPVLSVCEVQALAAYLAENTEWDWQFHLSNKGNMWEVCTGSPNAYINPAQI